MSKAQDNFSTSIRENLKIAGLTGVDIEAKAKALIELNDIGESMKETADGARAMTVKTIADQRSRGNTAIADALQKDLDSRPASARGVGATTALARVEKLTPLTGIGVDQTIKLGITKVSRDVKWQFADGPAREALVKRIKESGTDTEKLTASDLNKRIEAERAKVLGKPAETKK